MNVPSPRPWSVFALDSSRAVIYDANDKRVTGIIAKADAELIIRAVHLPGASSFGRKSNDRAGVIYPTRSLDEQGRKTI